MSVLLERKSNWLHRLIRNNIPKDKPDTDDHQRFRSILFSLGSLSLFRRSKSIRIPPGELSRTMNNNKRRGYKGIRHVVRCSVYVFSSSSSSPSASVWQWITNIQRTKKLDYWINREGNHSAPINHLVFMMSLSRCILSWFMHSSTLNSNHRWWWAVLSNYLSIRSDMNITSNMSCSFDRIRLDILHSISINWMKIDRFLSIVISMTRLVHTDFPLCWSVDNRLATKDHSSSHDHTKHGFRRQFWERNI